MTTNSKSIILMIIVGLICGLIGYLIGVKLPGNQKGGVFQPTIGSGNLDIFTSASATVQGLITKQSGGNATIKTSAGIEGIYKVSDQVSVFTLKPGVKQATSSAGLDDSLLNRKVIVNLVYKNGRFEIVSVSLIPDVVASPPAATRSK